MTQTLSLHRCKICGTRWLLWPAGVGGTKDASWNLLDKYSEPGQCCNNVAMGDQIEHLRDFDLASDRAVKEPDDEEVVVAMLAASAATLRHLWDIAGSFDSVQCNRIRDEIHILNKITLPTIEGLQAKLAAEGLIASPASQKEQEVEALRAQFAAFADKIQDVEVKASVGSDWGHMRYAILAMLSVLQSTARKMANGQPAYVPTYKLRAEKAEAEIERLRTEVSSPARPQLEQLIAKWRELARLFRQGAAQAHAAGYMWSSIDDYKGQAYEACAKELETAFAEGAVSAAPPAAGEVKEKKDV